MKITGPVRLKSWHIRTHVNVGLFLHKQTRDANKVCKKILFGQNAQGKLQVVRTNIISGSGNADVRWPSAASTIFLLESLPISTAFCGLFMITTMDLLQLRADMAPAEHLWSLIGPWTGKA